MNTDRAIITGKYFLYENALNNKAYIFNEFVSLVRDKIRVEKYISCTSGREKQNGQPFILCLICYKTSHFSLFAQT